MWRRGARAREREGGEERGREDRLLKGRRKQEEASKVASLVWKRDRTSLLCGVVVTLERRGVFLTPLGTLAYHIRLALKIYTHRTLKYR